MAETFQDILNTAKQRFAPGGSFAGGATAELGRTKTKTIAAGEQALVSSGLYNTTARAGLSSKFEEEVGQPTKARIEDTRTARATDIDLQLANLTASAQEGQATRDAAERRISLATPSNAQQGLDVFGRPMEGSQAYYDAQLSKLQLEAAQRGTGGAGGAGGSGAYPNLYGNTNTGGGSNLSSFSNIGGTGGGASYTPIDWSKIALAGQDVTYETDPVTGEQIASQGGQMLARIGDTTNDPAADPGIGGIVEGPTAEQQAKSAKVDIESNQESPAGGTVANPDSVPYTATLLNQFGRTSGSMSYEDWYRATYKR